MLWRQVSPCLIRQDVMQVKFEFYITAHVRTWIETGKFFYHISDVNYLIQIVMVM